LHHVAFEYANFEYAGIRRILTLIPSELINHTDLPGHAERRAVECDCGGLIAPMMALLGAAKRAWHCPCEEGQVLMFEMPRPIQSAVVGTGDITVGFAPHAEIDFHRFLSVIWRDKVTILWTTTASLRMAVRTELKLSCTNLRRNKSVSPAVTQLVCNLIMSRTRAAPL
jgi:hypothetical protein